MSLSNVCLAYFIQVIPQIMQCNGFRKFFLISLHIFHRMNVLVNVCFMYLRHTVSRAEAIYHAMAGSGAKKVLILWL